MDLQVNLTIRTVGDQKYALVSIGGCIDEHSLSEFSRVIEPLLEGDHTYLVLDLGGLDLVSSKAVGYLENMHRKLAAVEKRMAFVNANEEIQETLEFIGLAKLITMFDGEDKFVEAMCNEAI